MISEVPSNLSHSLILWFSDSSFVDAEVSEKRAYVAFVYEQKAPCISPHMSHQKLVSVLQLPEYNSQEVFKKDGGRKKQQQNQTNNAWKRHNIPEEIFKIGKNIFDWVLLRLRSPYVPLCSVLHVTEVQDCHT